MTSMRGIGFAIEQRKIEEINDSMKHLDLARSERYRNLVILGLDEYAIARRNSSLRKKKFPINGKKLIPFTVMLPDAINKEIEKVKKNRKQIKRLAIRYLVFLGFEKWKNDLDVITCQKVEPDPKVEAVQKSYKPWKKDISIDKADTVDSVNFHKDNIDAIENKKPESFIKKHNYRFDENKMAGPDPEEIKPVSNDMNIGEKFQAVIDLVRELDLKITIEKK